MMDYLAWRRVFFLLLTVVVAQFSLQYAVRVRHKTEAANDFEVEDSGPEQRPRPYGDTLHPAADRDVCHEDFPDLYHALDRAIAFWATTNHTVSNKNVRISSRRGAVISILVENNELRVLSTNGVIGNKEYRARAIAILGLIERALWAATVANEHLPVIEAVIAVSDAEHLHGGSALDDGSVWTFAADMSNERHKQHWLIPHYSLYSTAAMGSFEDMRREALRHDALFANKIPKLAVEGADEILKSQTFQISQGQDLVVESSMAMEELCQFAFMIDREGYGRSASALVLLNCNSLLLKPPSKWTTYLHHLFVPEGQFQNYVPIKHEFVDLETNMRYYLAHPEKAQHIIENAVDTFRSKYTTATATSCYIRRLITAYSTVSLSSEARSRSVDNISGVVRGISFVDFIILENDYDGHNIHLREESRNEHKRLRPQDRQYPLAAE